MVLIRDARASDGLALGLIDHAGWSPSIDPGEHWPADRPFFGEETQTRVEDVLVASAGGTPLAFIKIQPRESDFGDWYIAGLSVAIERRRQGIGELLVRAALARAEAAKGRGVWLKVLSSNTPAVELYQSCGFEEVARHRDSVTVNGEPVDDVRFALALL